MAKTLTRDYSQNNIFRDSDQKLKQSSITKNCNRILFLMAIASDYGQVIFPEKVALDMVRNNDQDLSQGL